ncbi:TPA: hypothetical protein HA242_06285 [Candidatus Woesearchaeota archaeon]|nr:hypothetical protein [Candidatus Woesearchaeota archaeon]HIH13303.1 hypothetical protein [Candidatus Woesearchaeota archaeon]
MSDILEPIAKLIDDATPHILYRIEGMLTAVNCEVRPAEKTAHQRPEILTYVHIDGIIRDLEDSRARIPFLYTCCEQDDDARIERILAQDALIEGRTIRLEGILKLSEHSRYLSVHGISVAREDGTYLWKQGTLE